MRRMGLFGGSIHGEGSSGIRDESRKAVENPAGLIIYSIENGLPVPASFVSSRKRRTVDETRESEVSERQREATERLLYREWLEDEQEHVIRGQLSQAELDIKLTAMTRTLNQSDNRFRDMPQKSKTEFARRMAFGRSQAGRRGEAGRPDRRGRGLTNV